MEIYERFGVATVVNAAGKLTALGGTAQTKEVAVAQAEAARFHVDLASLRSRAGELIAMRCGAEAANVTTGAAAGVVVSVAACVAGDDPERVSRLPDSGGWVNTVLLQAGHWVNFGAPVEQMVRLGGGHPIRVGSRDRVTDRDLDAALAQPVAALLFVQSHHAAQERQLSLEQCVTRAHARGVPVVVDAAAEEDLRRYIGMGVDLVTYSGGKAFGGPTVGFIAGRRDLVIACEAQQRGIARAMKVGKEQIIGLLEALDSYQKDDDSGEEARRRRVNTIISRALKDAPGVRTTPRMDEAGRPIERVAVSAIDDAFDVRDLVRYLEGGEPSIRTRNHQLRSGIILFDPRELSEAQAEVIAARLRAFFSTRTLKE